MNISHTLTHRFTEFFGNTTPQLYFSPGRVNLIGEHTDYNGGYVMPCALSLGTFAAAAPNNQHNCRVMALNFPNDGIHEINSATIPDRNSPLWSRYPHAVFAALASNGFPLSQGLDILYYGNLPSGAGLSSSASIEVLTAIIALDFSDITLDGLRVALLAQEAENTFIGVQCGIMDQFSVSMGQKDHALLLHCSTLKYRHIPCALGEYCLIISNTNKARALSGSAYNTRREECAKALELLQKKIPCSELCEVDVEAFENNKHLISDNTLFRRARHVITENQRTLLAAALLEKGDLSGFGNLMTKSHHSLRNDYEVSCFELDTLVQLALEIPGVAGSRMTGAGFGGCTVSLVPLHAVEEFTQFVGKGYAQKTGYKADFYVAQTANGASKIEEVLE